MEEGTENLLGDAAEPATETKKKVSIGEQIRTIKPSFWLANILEAFERLAFFGVRAVLPLFMISETGGGLGLSYSEKGLIYMIWALIQCFVPLVSGGFSDYYGYKKSLIIAFLINIGGYCLMANAGGFGSMLAAACCIGLGTAIFKPPVQGTVAKSLNEDNSGIGFGFFYWVVNIGGFVAPFAAAYLRGDEAAPTWKLVFYGAAIVTAINLLLSIVFFRDPPKTKTEKSEAEADAASAAEADADPLKDAIGAGAENAVEDPLKASLDASDDLLKGTEGAATMDAGQPSDETAAAEKEEEKTPMQVFVDTITVLFKDRSMLLFLLIISGFWLMFMQLWDLLPNFIDEWVDTRDVGGILGYLGLQSFIGPDGAAKPEILIDIDSATILLLVLPLAWLFGKPKMIVALVVGMIVSIVGFVAAGMTPVGAAVAFMIFVFAIGEIICSPKFSEYIGMTAPVDKKALYMGYSNIPFAIGWAFGNGISGPLYDAFSSKAALARNWLASTGVDPATLENMKLKELMAMMCEKLGGVDVYAANQLLWDTYHPWVVWPILGALGLVSLVGMVVFYKKSDMAKRKVQ